LYGLVMIVKDASGQLERTLPTLAPLIGAWTVVDTGSSDDTKAVVQRHLGGIPGTLYERPWVNFGHNRSEALNLAPADADWLILSDADMGWTIDPDFVPDPNVDAYAIEMGNETFSWRLPLLVNNRRKWVSVGAVHEITLRADGKVTVQEPTDKVQIDMPLANAGPEKLAWYASMLQAEVDAQPENARSTFYLAQTLRELGRGDEARDYYLRRVALGGWPEEVYYAAWRAASLLPDVESIPELLSSWELRPERLEALADALRRMNAIGLHRAAWLLSSVDTSTIPPDTLFVHGDVWDWRIMFERSIAAWWVGEHEEFDRLTDLLLENPRLPDVIRERVVLNAAL
jgi:hypothetical protein